MYICNTKSKILKEKEGGGGKKEKNVLIKSLFTVGDAEICMYLVEVIIICVFTDDGKRDVSSNHDFS